MADELELVPAYEFPEQSFDDFFDEATQIASASLIEDGGHAPLVFVCAAGSVWGFDITQFYATPEGRDALLNGMWEIFGGRAIWFVRVCEAWEASDENLDIRPSENPQRREVLIVSGMNLNGKRRSRHFPMVRDRSGKLIRLGRPKVHRDTQDVLQAPLFGRPLVHIVSVSDIPD